MIKYVVFDTETTGLNIKTDKPFMCQYLYADENIKEIKKGYFWFNSTNPDYIKDEQEFRKTIKEVKIVVGANIKFDIHMLLNIGYPEELFKDKILIDTEVLARLCIPHDLQEEKNFSVALKKLAVRYLKDNSDDEQKYLKNELTRLTSIHKQGMIEYFKSKGLWPDNLISSKSTELINKIYDDKNWFKYFDTFLKFKQARKEYLNIHPRPCYKDVSNINAYALKDVVLTLGLLNLWLPKIKMLGQADAFKRTCAATYSLVMMEREGMVVDIKKVLDDRKFLLNYKNTIHLIDPRTGKEVSIGQHKLLKEIYEYESGKALSSADKNVRKEIEELSPTAKKANELALIEKIVGTYCTKMLRTAVKVGNEYRVYTQYNLASTVTGRLSSDFQQFPKEGTIIGGREINIRDWFPVPNDSKYLFYFDYSQLELRLQCEWTALVNGEPDLNMVRAFMPYHCTEREGKYYLNENPNEEWTPTDLHAMTTLIAFPQMSKDDEHFAHYRKMGKQCNFACNYGASPAKIADSLNVDMLTAERLVKGYKQSFKGVVDFGDWIGKCVKYQDHLPNLFQRQYYSKSRHKLQNWLVQGSGADLLLIKLKQLRTYLESHPWWKFYITVHDEIGFTCKDIDKEQLIKEVAEIKEIMKYSLSAVDVISDVEVTTTTWAHKLDWDPSVVE